MRSTIHGSRRSRRDEVASTRSSRDGRRSPSAMGREPRVETVAEVGPLVGAEERGQRAPQPARVADRPSPGGGVARAELAAVGAADDRAEEAADAGRLVGLEAGEA